MKFRNLILAAGMALGFMSGAASAATCGLGGATLTSIDGTAVNYNATACEGSFAGNLNPAQVAGLLNGGTLFSSYFSSALTWTYLGKDETAGTQSGQKVEASVGATTGTWSADFSPLDMNSLIVLIKASNEYSLFLFTGFAPTPGSSFAGGFDTQLAGLVNKKGTGQGLSHLEVAGVYVQCSPTDPNCDPDLNVVPLPATLPMLLGAIGVAGFVARRKSRKA